ncbi:uncharacterized protein BHQ10_008635 [Talaromyces amestolkiae]|uniref:Uncharacterized protein n=1 Tax=Talaromyces amestolkiae TaxID=1196081 RepID=A0A364LA28_TALAM|nr:uncharacterized protein BHQ10_008635 [Talaromyces amestolkiae]RAO72623.1 hypothetical protein BHQ10_008635 [Talaromyces amestolkiae]
MEARHSFSPTAIPNGQERQSSVQQEPGLSHQPPSQSSQTYTQAPSGTGHGASGQSVTTHSELVEINDSQPDFAHEHRRAVTPDQHDSSHAGSWATVAPQADPSLIENEPILSPIHRAGAAINVANQKNAGNDNTEAVGIFKASLHREGAKEQSALT